MPVRSTMGPFSKVAPQNFLPASLSKFHLKATRWRSFSKNNAKLHCKVRILSTKDFSKIPPLFEFNASSRAQPF